MGLIGLAFGLVFGLSFWLAFGVLAEEIRVGAVFGASEQTFWQTYADVLGDTYWIGLWLIVGVGLVFGMAFSLAFGGAICIMHYSLRLSIYFNNFTPINYVKFLNYAADRIFLQKVGGGYTFIHRMIMDYFAHWSHDNHSISQLS